MPDSMLARRAATLFDNLLPCPCVICMAVSPSKIPGLCTVCEPLLPAMGPVCGQCSLPLSGLAHIGASEALQSLTDNGGLRCGQCLSHPPIVDKCRAAFLYRAPISALLGRFKYQSSYTEGRVLAELFARSHVESMRRSPPQALVAVPLFWRKRVARGFNQSEWLCTVLSDATGVPSAQFLQRTRATSDQQSLALDARPDNVRGAFKVKKDVALPEHIAVVDDVITSMATVKEIARVLKAAGVKRVDAYCLARTELL